MDHTERSQPRLDLQKLQLISGQGGSANANGGAITLYCKDLRIFKIEVSDWQEYLNVAESIEKLSKVATAHMYAFFFRPLFPILEDGYTLFRPEAEFAKLLATGSWRITKVNDTYQVCPTYGRSLIVPASVSDAEIRESAAFRG